jgi:GT2 family glycosyltransferase
VSPRWSGEWGLPAEPATRADLQVLIPSYERASELAVTLSGLAAQTDTDFDVIVSDQSDEPPWQLPVVQAMVRVLRAQGRQVRLERNLPRRGLAQQRDFLLGLADAPRVLFLDDDVWCEPGLLTRMMRAMDQARCGFIGAAVQGLSYLDDRRPAEWQAFEPWEAVPEPELVQPGTPAFERWRLHNAANLAHLAAEQRIPRGEWLLYKVAWVGGCVLFDRQRLLAAGGFSFWRSLPPSHAGEDVVAQMRVMARFGGAGLLPSGAVHLESPTTVTNREIEARDIVPTVPVSQR